jgi:hypothetical protein
MALHLKAPFPTGFNATLNSFCANRNLSKNQAQRQIPEEKGEQLNARLFSSQI